MSRALIATLNSGSSSVKIAVYKAEADGTLGSALLRASISGLPDTPELAVKSVDQDMSGRFRAAANLSDLDLNILAPRLVSAIEMAIGAPVDALGHRIVQGGPNIAGSYGLS